MSLSLLTLPSTTPFERTVVQTLTVVDNSVFSPIRLTVPSDHPYVQEALSFALFKQRGYVWPFMCSYSCSCASSSSLSRCCGVFLVSIFKLPTHQPGADA